MPGSSTISTRGEQRHIRVLDTQACSQRTGMSTHMLLVKASHMTSLESRGWGSAASAWSRGGSVCKGKGEANKSNCHVVVKEMSGHRLRKENKNVQYFW